MMVRIDEAGDDGAVCGVDRLIGLEIHGHGRGHGTDLIVLDQHMMVLQLLDAVAAIPADDVAAFYEQFHARGYFYAATAGGGKGIRRWLPRGDGRPIGTAFLGCVELH